MEAYLLLGSNQGNRLEYLEQAMTGLEGLLGKARRKSSIYETAAWGKTDQPAFLNQAAAFSLEPGREAWLLEEINRLEERLGRIRDEHWGPRVIDIDFLLAGEQVIGTDRLTVPHPCLHLRRFALEPLCEIAADAVHPILGKTVSELLQTCPDRLEVRKLG